MASSTISFAPPSDDGGSVITSYTVTSTPGGITATGVNSPIVVTGLTNGTSYTFTVRATNAEGDGPESAASNAVIPWSDPDFANVSLLLHGNGTNNSTNIIDSGPLQLPVTVYGAAKISTAQSKFGGASLYLDGPYYGYIEVSHSNAFAYGVGDFTVEFFYRTGGLSEYLTITNRDPDSAAAGAFALDITQNALTVADQVQSGTNVGTSGAPAVEGWRHFAVSRSSGVLKIFIDGIAYYSAAHSRNYNSTFPLVIGRWETGSYTSGYLDELRITKGVGRYTADFTPPTTPFLNL